MQNNKNLSFKPFRNEKCKLCGLISDLFQTLKQEIISILYKISEDKKRGDTFQLFWWLNLNTKSDKDIRKKDNYKSITPMNIEAKIPNKILGIESSLIKDYKYWPSDIYSWNAKLA
jgi:hypothetical protein